MANNLKSNPIIIDTLAAGDNVITSEQIKLFQAVLYSNAGAGLIRLKDNKGDTKAILAVGAAGGVDRQEWGDFPIYANSLVVDTGYTFPAGSYLLIYV